MRKIEPLIKELLVRRGLSIEKMAALADISNPTIHSIFKKNDAKVSQLEAICQVLQVPILYLFDESYGINQSVEPASPPYGLDKKDADLQLCLEKVKQLEMRLVEKDERLKDKDEMIEILKKK
jgi:transcriptional regulator with XRE-family HTH domain